MANVTPNLSLPLSVHGLQAIRQSFKEAMDILDTYLGDQSASLLSSSEEVETGADAVEASIAVYQTVVTTGGTEGAEDLTLGDGTGAIVGQRKLITLGTRTHASDSVTLDDANFSVTGETITAIELDAADEFILVEWQGAAWEVIKATAGVVTSS